MDSFFQDLRYGIRTLLKSPGFTAVAIVTLALGIGANTAIFSVLNAVLLRPLPYKDPEQLVMIWRINTDEGKGQGTISYPDFLDWRGQGDVFAHTAAYRSDVDFTLTGIPEPVHLRRTVVSAYLFSLLGIQPILGRTFLPEEDNLEAGRRAVILSHQLWQGRFGSDPTVLGRTVTLNNKSFVAVGVMPAGFQFPVRARLTDLWTTVAIDAEVLREGPQSMANRSWRYLWAIARLKPQVTIAQAQAEMTTIASHLARQYPDSNAHRGVWIQPTLEALVGDVRPILLILSGAVGFVLLIVCANIANLLLARSRVRQKEMAIRAALGAGRWRIVRQLLTESLLISCLGGLLGLALASLGTGLLVQLGQENIPRAKQLTFDGWVLGFTLLVSVLTGLVFGLVPALNASRMDLTGSLKQAWCGWTGEARKYRLGSALAEIEIALTLVLLVGASLLLQTLLRLERVDPGFDPHQVLTFKVDLPDIRYLRTQQTAFFQQLVSGLRTVPGIRSASAIGLLPFGPYQMTGRFEVEGHPIMKGELPGAIVSIISPDYFRTLKIPFLRGRDFSVSDDLRAPKVVIISRTLAERHFPNQDPVGKRLMLESPCEIVGVVGDVKIGDLGSTPESIIYQLATQSPTNSMTVVVSTEGNPLRMVNMVRHTVASLDKDLPLFEVKTLDQYLTLSLAQIRFISVLTSVFATMATVISVAGLYGVISYLATQRTREIGIRMALGAQPGDVLQLVVGQGMRFTLMGVIIGLAASVALAACRT